METQTDLNWAVPYRTEPCRTVPYHTMQWKSAIRQGSEVLERAVVGLQEGTGFSRWKDLSLTSALWDRGLVLTVSWLLIYMIKDVLRKDGLKAQAHHWQKKHTASSQWRLCVCLSTAFHVKLPGLKKQQPECSRNCGLLLCYMKQMETICLGVKYW